MSGISNIWKHPKTSAAGVLIAVASVAGALSQQGITLGKAGTGSLVTVIAAVATALLGLLAQDPATKNGYPDNGPGAGGSTAKLGAWLLIALLVQMPFVSGCSGATVAQDIVNWTPALQSAVATVDSTAAVLAPADASAFTTATAGFDAASNLLAAQARAYLAHPSAGTLAQMQAQVVAFQQQVNASLLQAARIVNPESQSHALATIQGVAAIVNAMLALVQSVSSKTAVAQMAAACPIKLAAVRTYLDDEAAVKIVAGHYGEGEPLARVQVEQAAAAEMAAGF